MKCRVCQSTDHGESISGLKGRGFIPSAPSYLCYYILKIQASVASQENSTHIKDNTNDIWIDKNNKLTYILYCFYLIFM